MTRPVAILDVAFNSTGAFCLADRADFERREYSKDLTSYILAAESVRIVATPEAGPLIRYYGNRMPKVCVGSPYYLASVVTADNFQETVDRLSTLRSSQGGWHRYDTVVDGAHYANSTAKYLVKSHPAVRIVAALAKSGWGSVAGLSALVKKIRDPRWFSCEDSLLRFSKLHTYLGLHPIQVRRYMDGKLVETNKLHCVMQALDSSCPTGLPAAVFAEGKTASEITKELKLFITYLATCWLGSIMKHPELITPDYYFPRFENSQQLLAIWKDAMGGAKQV